MLERECLFNDVTNSNMGYCIHAGPCIRIVTVVWPFRCAIKVVSGSNQTPCSSNRNDQTALISGSFVSVALVISINLQTLMGW